MCCVQVHIGSEQMETEMEKKRKPAKSVILAQPRCRPNAVALKLVPLLHICSLCHAAGDHLGQ